MTSPTVQRVHHLVGVREIAAMFGVSPQRADQLSHAREFPAPVVELASGRVWERAAVEEWAKATGRQLVDEGGTKS
jgi:predicted DNA-binding transcriptional regulator AlpA